MPTVRGGTTVLCCCLAVAISGCGATGGDGSQAVLQQAGEPSGNFGAIIPAVDSGRSITFGSLPLCVTSGDQVTLTGVSPVNGENIDVVAFATRPGGGSFGSDFTSLPDAGFNPAHRTVDAPCPDDGSELGLELRRGPGAQSARSEGFTIQYEAGGREPAEFRLPFHVLLCAPTDTDADC